MQSWTSGVHLVRGSFLPRHERWLRWAGAAGLNHSGPLPRAAAGGALLPSGILLMLLLIEFYPHHRVCLLPLHTHLHTQSELWRLG